MKDRCPSKIQVRGSVRLVQCDSVPHNKQSDHSAQFAVLLQPVLDLRRNPKWITGNITWKDN